MRSPGTVRSSRVGAAGHKLRYPKQPINILRTIHSVDPCIACAVHVTDTEGEELMNVKVV